MLWGTPARKVNKAEGSNFRTESSQLLVWGRLDLCDDEGAPEVKVVVTQKYPLRHL